LADLWIQRDPLLGYSVLAHTLASLWRWVLGFGVAGVLGLLVGTALGRVRVLHTAFMPMVHALQLIPGLAWVPVTILMFGLNDGATVFMITISAFAPMVINVAAGMRATHEAHIAVARMVGASSTMTFWRVLVPSSIPHILSGIRVALGNSWRVVVAAEMVLGTGLGLGYSIIQSRWTLDYASSFACIIVIGLIGLATEHFLIGRIERMTIKRWGAGGTA
jgi:ABC-type nitrate/sulfonate/bicarbonate transport system permease component